MAGDAIDTDVSKKADSKNKEIVQFLSENSYNNSTGSDADEFRDIVTNREKHGSLHRSATVLFGNNKLEQEEVLEKEQSSALWYDVAAFFFLGMSGWWVYNSLYMESPIFVQCQNGTKQSDIDMSSNSTPTGSYKCTLPEGKNITNQMSIMGQIGNLFPLLYRLLGRFCGPRRIRLPLVIGTWLVIGGFSAVVAAFFWQTHIRLFNLVDSSVPLLGATLLSGSLGCMSSMTYWQFAADFEVSHTKALSIGMATGGLFPAMMSTAQNTASNFSPKVMMLIAAGLQIFFILVFCRIAYLYYHINEKAPPEPKAEADGQPTQDQPTQDQQELLSPLLEDDSESARKAQISGERGAGKGDKVIGKEVKTKSKTAKKLAGSKGAPCCEDPFSYVPYATIFILYACTYSLPSLAPYMITNYADDLSKSIYTFMNLGYSFGDVLGRVFATAIKRVPSWSLLIILSLGVVALWAFQLFAAAANVWVDCHLLPRHLGYIFVPVQFTYYFVRGYIVTNMYVRVKKDYDKTRHSTITARMSTVGQLGSILGTLVPFFILTVFNLVPSNPRNICSS